jgi:hypothetical protein
MGSKRRQRPSTESIHAECPFTIKYLDSETDAKQERPATKRALANTGDKKGVPLRIQVQTFEFPLSGSDVHFVIQPNLEWSQMTRYASFVQNGIRYAIGDFIKVANEQSLKRQRTHRTQRPQRHLHWIARVLEVRATDPAHVYVRVAWMYWPHDLPSGGGHDYAPAEVIMSNHMDVINAMSVTDPAIVKRWGSPDEDKVDDDVFCYRQIFDCRSRLISPIDK